VKNYFFIGLMFTSFVNLYSMDDCFANKFLKLQQETWPLRRQLDTIKKYFTYKKPSLSVEQYEVFKSLHHTICESLDHVLTQCDHARMDLSAQKYSQIDKYINKAQSHLDQATKELNHYKLELKNTLKIDFDIKAAL
jgi:Mg2+ and Co2+ transporter CorA